MGASFFPRDNDAGFLVTREYLQPTTIEMFSAVKTPIGTAVVYPPTTHHRK